MKTGFVLLLSLAWLSVLPAQTDLYSALGKGDVDALASQLGDKVEMTIGDKEELLTRQEAVARLREFYAAHPAKGFRIVHVGNSKDKESYYQIGELTTTTGIYRVYLYFVQDGRAKRIAEMRFEE
jgi:hypothetical protein